MNSRVGREHTSAWHGNIYQVEIKKKMAQEIFLAYQFYGCISNLDENSFHDEKLTVHVSELLLQNKRKREV